MSDDGSRESGAEQVRRADASRWMLAAIRSGMADAILVLGWPGAGCELKAPGAGTHGLSTGIDTSPTIAPPLLYCNRRFAGLLDLLVPRTLAGEFHATVDVRCFRAEGAGQPGAGRHETAANSGESDGWSERGAKAVWGGGRSRRVTADRTRGSAVDPKSPDTATTPAPGERGGTTCTAFATHDRTAS